ncbi:MAG: hypothetical protein ACLTAS_11960 [Butyribacter sp.]|jgi:hypothetical protein|uniref:hypothetical protein n=1 Tax=Butyribacter intestini TaxID=1703332 RepID=UPI0009682442|nr:hypothetical protein [Clostridium sp.]OKZ79678.1 MAG: hypothetical protein BHW08_09375 [Clostridium sp. CAG:12237_41]
MKIKLEDNTELTVTESCTATTITAEFDTAVEIEDNRQKLTDKNLSEFKFVNDNGNIIGNYENYTFDNVTYTEKDNKFIAVYHLHKYSDIEVRLNAIEEGQATQNDAIAEMSEVIYSE